MSKKHFIAIADAMKAAHPVFDYSHQPTVAAANHARGAQWEHDCETLAAKLAEQFPTFKKDRWLGYIYGENGPSGEVIRKTRNL
jgi:hypothetical protein